ncbi:MAG TPA: PQQ-binding-like beta-propeller repeat protein [Candidatus Acidoferrales bacterium]|nr:PQQ-binding-like beta-propeller repeat protein [Candidatus Acidoferrales bacterium]
MRTIRGRFASLLLLVPAILLAATCASAQAAPDGAALFQQHCASCHAGAAAATSRAPSRAVLAEKTQQEILQTLESGAMVIYGNRMNEAERRALAAFLSSKVGADVSRANLCASAQPITPAGLADPHNWNGWGVDVVNSRYQPHTSLDAENVAQLKLKWAFGIPNASSALGQPTIVAGRLFIGSGDGTVYSLDASTGCTLWAFKADATVRDAITVAPGANGRAFAYFGDSEANLYALDASDGKLAWKMKVDPHPTARITGAPQLYDGRLYVPLTGNEELTGGDPSYPCCTFRGNITAVDARTGKLIWKAYGIAKTPGPSAPGTSHAKFSPAGGAMWSAPTIDAKLGRFYTGTGDAYVDPADEATDAIVAFDLATGKRVWLQQKTAGDVFNFGCFQAHPINCPPKVGPDFDFGSSVILQNLGDGHRVLLAGQKSGVLFALDPDDGGKELWQSRVGSGGGLGGIEWGFATDGTNAYVALSDIPSSLSPPKPGAVVPPSGGLFAIDIRTGKLVWKTMPPKPACEGQPGCSAGQLAAVTVVPGVVFSGSMDGHLRAYSAKDGSILWDYDTLPSVATVNGVEAHGGSMSGSGPTVSHGMVFVTSGFTGTSGMPGNLLLAFEAPSK